MIFKIFEPIYESELFCYVGDSWEKMRRDAAKEFPDYDLSNWNNKPGTVNASCNCLNDARIAYLWISRKPANAEWHGILAHEMCHFAFHVMDQIGNGYVSNNDDEPFCYFIKFLIREFWNAVNGSKKTTKGKNAK